jgi:hypothetical protein
MTQAQEQDFLQNMIVTYGKMQSLMHDVERMMETDRKRQYKGRLVNFSRWLEDMLHDTTSRFDQEGNDKFTAFTTKLDQAGFEFKKELSKEIILIDE